MKLISELRFVDLIEISKKNKLDKQETLSLIKSYFQGYSFVKEDLELVCMVAACIIVTSFIRDMITDINKKPTKKRQQPNKKK